MGFTQGWLTGGTLLQKWGWSQYFGSRTNGLHQFTIIYPILSHCSSAFYGSIPALIATILWHPLHGTVAVATSRPPWRRRICWAPQQGTGTSWTTSECPLKMPRPPWRNWRKHKKKLLVGSVGYFWRIVSIQWSRQTANLGYGWVYWILILPKMIC